MIKYCIEKIKNQKHSKPIIVLLFITAVLLLYIDRNVIEDKNTKVINIEVAQAKNEDVPIYLSALGTVTPDRVANVQPQITGQIIKIAFTEGQIVKKNDLLAEIDPSLYIAQVMKYKGQLKSNKALLKNASLDLIRYQELWKENSVSNQVLETQAALVEQYQGAVEASKGSLDGAQTNLSYCKVRAAFDGRVGMSLITEGNIVSSASIITTLNSFSPISVLFTLPQIDLDEVKQAFNKRKNIIIHAYDNTSSIISRGILSSIDNHINISTGAIKLKAKFENKDYKLFPNQFTNIKLLLKTLENVITIPAAAIQYSSKGAFIYLIKDNKANVTPVIVRSLNNGIAIIDSGLKENQLVAIAGVDKLSEDVFVEISNR